jgi:hypothetical protein
MEHYPQILHLSYRESKPENENRWLYVNLVFRVTEEFDIIACKGRCEEWSKNVIYEVEDKEQIHSHFLNTRLDFKPVEGSSLSRLESYSTDPKFDISDKKRVGLSLNPFYTLEHLEKFNVFVYRDYVEDNFVTRAALSMLSELKEGRGGGTRFVPFSTLTRCIDTLNTFWD